MSMRHGLLIVIIVALMVSVTVTPASAQASKEPEPPGNFEVQVYLTREEALSKMFPESDEILRDLIILTEEEKRGLEGRLRRSIYEQGFEVFIGRKDGEVQGYAVITEEIGKFHPFMFIVAVEPKGRIKDMAVLVYRESRGGEVVRRRFLHQFIGKTVRSPIMVNRDIINITGATMSVVMMCKGTKKVLAVVDEFYLSGDRGL
ncbi:MAG: hypothetical protein J3T61_13035, partial [Candidatus Brocadiales bacterium]|nr:hypothetical protein [Candidatus Bathyanammoxibius sp.]